MLWASPCILLIFATVGVAAGGGPTVSVSGAYSGTGAARDVCSNLLQALFPFGPSSGDTSASQGCDDCAYGPSEHARGGRTSSGRRQGSYILHPASALPVNSSVAGSFKFLGSSYSSVYMGTNGLVSFGTPVSTSIPPP